MSVSVYLRTDGADVDFNVANDNWTRIVELLGLELDDHWCGTFEGPALVDLRDRVVFALDAIKAMPAVDGGTPTVEVGPNHFVCGLGEGYFADRLSRLLAVVDRAIATGEPLHYA